MKELKRLRKIRDEKLREYQEARDAYDEGLRRDAVNKYLGQFVRFEEFGFYMFIENIWNSGSTEIYLEGPLFASRVSAGRDDYFEWRQWGQEKISLDLMSQGGTDLMSQKLTIVSKGEFLLEFKKATDQMIKACENHYYKKK